MPIYVFYQGRLIDKRYRPAQPQHAASELSAPAVQSFAAYESPIDGALITSQRQRERDLAASDSYDLRDTPASFRKAQDGRRQQLARRAAADA